MIGDYVHLGCRFAAVIAIQLCSYGLAAAAVISTLCIAFGRQVEAAVVSLFQLRTLRWIDDRAAIVHESAGRQAGVVDMPRPKDVHHALSCDEKIICDSP